MADVAKQETPAETTPAVDQNTTPEKVVENNPPQAEADKGKAGETPANDQKAETAGMLYERLIVIIYQNRIPVRML